MEEAVGLGDPALGIVDEAGLGLTPLGPIAFLGAVGQGLDLESFAALDASSQLGLRLSPRASLLLNRPVVFRAESLAHAAGMPLVGENRAHDDDDDHGTAITTQTHAGISPPPFG